MSIVLKTIINCFSIVCIRLLWCLCTTKFPTFICSTFVCKYQLKHNVNKSNAFLYHSTGPGYKQSIFIRNAPLKTSFIITARISKQCLCRSLTNLHFSNDAPLTRMLSQKINLISGITISNSQVLIQKRHVNFFSKKGKRKTVKSVAKRFKRLRSGALLRWRACRNHNMRKKSTSQKRRLRKPVVVTGRQLRKLNKMISGW